MIKKHYFNNYINYINNWFNKYIICILYFLMQHARVSISACDLNFLYKIDDIDRSPKVNCKINWPSARLLHQKLFYLLIHQHIPSYAHTHTHTHIYIDAMQACQYFFGWNSNVRTAFLFCKNSTSRSVVGPDEHVVHVVHVLILRWHNRTAFAIRSTVISRFRVKTWWRPVISDNEGKEKEAV